VCSSRGVFLEALQAHRVEVARDGRDEPARRHGLLIADLLECVSDRWRRKRRSPGQELVEHRTQAVNVGRGPEIVLTAWELPCEAQAPGPLPNHLLNKARCPPPIGRSHR